MQLPGVTREQCIQKWTNLKRIFIQYIENTKKTGAGRLSKPVGYDVMSTFLMERPITNPTTSSSRLAEASYSMQGLHPSASTSRCSDVDDPPSPQPTTSGEQPVAVTIQPSTARPSKRRRTLRPQSQTQQVRGLIQDFQEQVRTDNLELRNIVTGFVEETVQHQRALIAEERRRNDLLEELLRELKK